MSKKWLAALSAIALILVGSVVIFINKPDEADFVRWLTDTYEVDCMDDQCYTLKLSSEGGEASASSTYWNADGYYDSSTGFLNMGMQTKRLYRNRDNPDQFFSIEAEGFWGSFKEIKFVRNGVQVSRRD
ncbi:hypothetical protein AAEO50_19230 [Rossellomorea oryzaecorticis]|uniref:Uncharacterized protein n=1 Tax=Rossellomorea oryzaecorticis TaxID=1396505 RepID=A0ABU9KE97_9BACI